GRTRSAPPAPHAPARWRAAALPGRLVRYGADRVPAPAPSRTPMPTAQGGPHMSATPPADRSGQGDEPGRIMSGEMTEQPAMLRRILEHGAPRINEVAAEIAA